MIIDEWKRLAREGKAPAGEKLYKQGSVSRADGAAEAPIVFVMSTAAVDRMSDTIAVEGWDLANYRRNPVWLFGHDSHALPVGRSVKEYIDGDALKSDVVFTGREDNLFGWQVGQLVRKGFLNACSVGFTPKKYAINEERGGDSWCPPCDFLEQELLECSVVPIPANPEALVEGKSAGIDMGPLLAWAEQVLSRRHGKGLWLPQDTIADSLRGQAEATWKALRPVQVQVPAAKADDDPVACACGMALDPVWKFCPGCGELTTPEDPDADGDDDVAPGGDTDDDAKALAAVRDGVRSALAPIDVRVLINGTETFRGTRAEFQRGIEDDGTGTGNKRYVPGSKVVTIRQ